MKKILLSFVIIISMCFSGVVFSQTAGTLSVSFTPVAQSPCYSGTLNVLAAWIQSSTGAFVKTKLRYVGGGTSDHLPTWAVNSGGTATNATSSSCNKYDATTGATLSGFTAKSFVWDGKNCTTTANGTTVADGTYKVAIQETWNHGTTSTYSVAFSFTKGPTSVTVTPTDAKFSNIKIIWTPASTTAVEEAATEIEGLNVFPNPSNDGIFHVDFEKASNIKVVNLLGVVIYDEKVDQTIGTKNVDLSNEPNGIYFICVNDGDKSSKRKVILNR
ncbi:MAG TPA: T9SS type A sorting domain-containing protein [Bacteroidia bacterium]